MTQNHATGYHFDGAADGSFKLALEKCNFPKDKTSPDYLKYVLFDITDRSLTS